jgi:hypothetical protein
MISSYDSLCDYYDNIIFDFKNGISSHHLVGVDNNSKNFKLFHKIKSKSLFMTATEKISIDKIKYYTQISI